ncbi:MAG: Npt1/Npt2 family nucleotide transporter [Gemmatimonadota bacterium]
MNLLERIAVWFDVRPNEVRTVTLSFLGAFLVMAFLILARSLREAFYLTSFDVKTLPYITAAVAVLSVPTVGVFARTLARHPPTKVLTAVLLVLGAGLAILWPFATRSTSAAHRDVAVVIFYLWTAVGTLLITSGFWVVTSEYFPIRGAKRLFGLIGAGGTAGAMVTGSLLIWLTREVDLGWLILGLIGLILVFAFTQRLLPKLEIIHRSKDEAAEKSPLKESCGAVWRSPHLRAIAAIVFTVGIATTLLDYQFKELAQAHFTTREGLTSFFGAFYGWTGGVALLIQLAVVARFLTVAGVAWSLALLPLTLLLGSVGMLIVPSLILIVAVRGADASLRKSLYRSALEVLYVPVPSLLRRKTKTFIDSVLDSVGEGLGAGIVLLWVTLSGFPSRYLSGFIIVLSVALLVLSRRMGRQYFSTITEQLQVSGSKAQTVAAAARLEGRDLLSGTFTRLDIRSLIDVEEAPNAAGEETGSELPAVEEGPGADGLLARLRSPELATVARTLEETLDWEERHFPELSRLLARDPLFDRVILAFMTAGESAVPHLAALLSDKDADFVIRRRIPRVLARMGGVEAGDALLDALDANRFEVRYRAAIALVRRRRRGLPQSERDPESLVWEAIRSEVSRGRPVWEMQKLLDDEPDDDALVSKRIGVRGELSLEHTFRLLSLVLEPEVVRAAFHGIVLDDERLESFSLEYLEQVLPPDVRKKLWPFIGDVSEYQREKSMRSLDEVVSDLMTTGATLFADAQDRVALKRILEERED